MTPRPVHLMYIMKVDGFKKRFITWFKKFIEFTNPSTSEVRAFTAGWTCVSYQKHRTTSVILLCFPPHCTHRLQPLDVSIMVPISVYYEQEVRKWLIQHPGRCVTIYEVAKLLGAAFSRAALNADSY